MNKSTIIWLVAVPMAILSMLASAGSVTKLSNPSLSNSVWPINGFALAEMAESRLKQALVESKGDLGAPLDDQTVAYATAALLREPTATSAIRNLGVARENKKKPDQAFALMDHAGKLTKRDAVTNLWLGKAKSADGSITHMIRYLDQTLRTSSAARPILLQALANGMSNKEFVAPMTQILKTTPDWSAEFWDYAIRTDPALENAALVRVNLLDAVGTKVEEKDRELIAALARNKKFGRGQYLYQAMQPASAKNIGFSRAPQLPPYDWELISRGDYGATLIPETSQLEINSISLKGGVVAQRLIALSRGRYQLSAKLENKSEGLNYPIYVGLSCAEQTGQKAKEQRIALSGGKATYVISAVDSQCTYHWLKIGIGDVDNGRGFDAAISQLSLSPL